MNDKHVSSKSSLRWMETSSSPTPPRILEITPIIFLQEIKRRFLPDSNLEIPGCYVRTLTRPGVESVICRSACRFANIFGDAQRIDNITPKDFDLGSKTKVGASLLAAAWRATLEEMDCWRDTDEVEGVHGEFDDLYNFRVPAALRHAKCLIFRCRYVGLTIICLDIQPINITYI
jgi:hypothetical protein